MLSQVTKKDIDRLIYENIPIEKNPNYPNLESSGWKWKKYADGSCELWYQVTIARTTTHKFTYAYFPFTLADANWQHTVGVSGAAFTKQQISDSNSADARYTTHFIFNTVASAATLNGYFSFHISGRWK